mgnify:CR=1 FL=1
MKKLDFCYIGVDKAGSTWLYEYLNSHSKVGLPISKETFFFTKFYARGESWLRDQFTKNDKSLIFGEVCHDYIFSENTLKRLYAHNKDIKIIFFLRDPKTKLISNYNYWKKVGLDTGPFKLTFNEALNTKSFINKAIYSKIVKNALNIFPSKNIFYALYDELQEDPEELAKNISNFLGIEFNSGHDTKRVVLKSKASRFQGLTNLLRKFSWIMRSIGLSRFVQYIKNNKILNYVLFKDISKDSKIIFPEILKNKLLNDIVELESILNVDLTKWKTRLKD